MDDIAACIKDHQYNEAIRKTVVDSDETLAKAIVDVMPPPKLEGKTPDKNVVPVEQLLSSVTLDSMASRPVGRYFLCELAIDKNPKFSSGASVKLQQALDKLNEYSSSAGHAPSRSEAEQITQAFVVLSQDAGFPLDIKALAARASDAVAKADFITGSASVNDKIFAELETAVRKGLFESAFAAFQADTARVTQFRNLTWYSDRPVVMDDFLIFRELGRGAFGVVSGARHRCTGQMVALKAMNRKLIKGKGVLKMVRAEFEILKTLGEKPSQYCVSLLYSFMDSTDITLGLPLCTGGDLMFHLRSARKGYGHARAKYFAAEIALAIEHLHNLGILYRDLKPENVLLDDKGHTKVSDMGLAVLTKYTPRTLGSHLFTGRAGTPGYWPPEMIKKTGYGFDADWWSYGVMLFEFYIGQCPFTESWAKTADRDAATTDWPIVFPDKVGGLNGDETFPAEAKDLICKLLDRDRAKRLGAKPDAIDLVKAHPYFADVEWGVRLVPPWLPPADAINAVSQSELAERNKEGEYKKIKLEAEDEIPDIQFSSRYHEQDIVRVLELEKKGLLKELHQPNQSSACAIL
jgi:serine/threonine protein kinase